MNRILFGVVLVAALVAAKPGPPPCVVTPNPAPVGSDVTVTATGLEPGGVLYWLWVSQPGNQIPGAHPAYGTETDAAGDWAVVINLDTVYGGPLEPGRVALQVKPDLKGLDATRCDFTIG